MIFLEVRFIGGEKDKGSVFPRGVCSLGSLGKKIKIWEMECIKQKRRVKIATTLT